MSAIEPPAPSKLRLPSPEVQRFLKGYGPLAALIAAFALMAVLAPTVAPGRLVGSSTAGAGSGGALGAAGKKGLAGTAGAAGTGAGALSSGAAGSSSTSGAAAAGHSTPCPGQSQQVPGDPYSPPCIAFSGSNGGATSQGVTGDTITVSYRVTSDPGFQQTLASIGGAQFSDTTADIERTITNLSTYFNNKFQFYGRKIKVDFFNGQGSQTNELLGQGQQQADADAITASQQIHAFAELDGTTEPYDDALAQQHVVALGAPYLSANWMAQRQPYEWSLGTECNDVASTTAEFFDKEMANKPAAYAGGSLKNQTRKVAVIAPDNPWYQDCANAAIATAQAAGDKVTDDIQYQLDLSTLSSQAASVVAKLQNDGITTIICGCDPVFPVYLTSRAAEQNYTPEWVVAGVALTDTDIVGQLFDQSEWAHALGVSFAGPEMPKQATLGYAAYKQVASDEPANVVDLIYAQMYMLAIGIQMAGPALTPQSFQQGMRAYPGSQAGAPNAEFGTWAFPNNHFTPQMDSVIIYWDPNKTSPYNGKQGAYVIASPRYQSGQYPTTPPPVPASFGQ
jgi:hypothetical protein